jgi:hypothetical protein
MPAQPISLNEASWRLEKSDISGRAFAELLLKSQPLLLGVRPGYELHDPVVLSQVTSFRAEPENVVVADGVRWTEIKLDWAQICAAFKSRGRRISWSWHSDITPELLEWASRPDPSRRLPGDARPLAPSTRPARTIPRQVRQARPEWFEGAVFTGALPASGKSPPGKRGPKSGKRENAAAAIRKALQDQTITEEDLRATREKVLAARYGISRDTARKARNDVLQSIIGNSTSTNDK